MIQYKKDGVVFTKPSDGKMLRIKGTKDLISRAADYEDKLPEYEEVSLNTEQNQ